MRNPFAWLFRAFTPPPYSSNNAIIHGRPGAKAREKLRAAVAETLETRLHLTVTAASITPPTENIVAGATLTFALAATSDSSTISGWNINTGDGQFFTVDGNPSSFSHMWSTAGNFTIGAVAYDGDDVGAPEFPPSGAGNTVSQTISVCPPSFDITHDNLTVATGSFSSDVQSVPQYFGGVSDYSGTLSVNDNTYGLEFSQNGSDLRVGCTGFSLASGSIPLPWPSPTPLTA